MPDRAESGRRYRARAAILRVALVSLNAVGVVRPGTADAEPLRLAVAVDQGIIFPQSYAFNGLLVPAADLGRLRLAVEGGAAFQNPKWAAIFGVRPSVVLWAPVTSSTGLRLVGEAAYLTRGAWRAGGGLAVDVESVQFGVLAGYDSDHRAATLLTTLAFDIPTIARFLGAAPFAAGPGCGAQLIGRAPSRW